MKNISLLIKKRLISYIMVISIMLPVVSVSQSASGERVNLGLYGGSSADFVYDTGYRVFSAVESPGSLFYSDDTCKTWTQAFPVDSLEYGTSGNQRGWSGGRRVVANQNGWIGVRTHEAGGTKNASVISYQDGDSGTFVTAFDKNILQTINPAIPTRTVTAVGISDYWFYVGMSNYLLRTNDTATYGMHNFCFDLDTVSIADTCTTIQYIAVSNTPSGYPLLIVTVSDGSAKGKLLLFDGQYFSEIAPPTDVTGGGSSLTFDFQKVWIHPVDTTLDTIIVSTIERSLSTIRVYLSIDGGSTWGNITPASGTNWAMQNADYYPQWESAMTVSNGLRLSFPGGEYSDDLGTTWSSHVMPDNAVAFSPYNPDLMIASKNRGPQLSTDGGSSFITPDNEGHAAVSITKIAQRNTNVYYVATKAGLGYTTVYHDTTVTGLAQWQPPYGDFPISGVGGDAGVSAVDIDPGDSLHIVVGFSGGFYYTTTGPSGFTLITPTDWDSGTHRDYQVTDVQFITSDTIIAVSGTGSNVWPSLLFDYGNIWKSTDGGASWTKSHPTDGGVDFEQGNSVAVSYTNVDTVIYLGCGYWDSSFPKVDGQLWKSTDFGDSWSYVNSGPESQMSGSTVTDMPIYDLDIYPASDDTLFFAAGQNLDYAFAKSVDGGVNYSYINSSNYGGAFSSVMIHPDDPDIVSVAARRDLWRHNTVLNSTTLVFEGLPGEFIPDLEYGSTLMGTSTGLYKLSETQGSVTTIWRGDGNWSDAEKWSNGIPYNISIAIVDSGQINVDTDGQTYDLIVKPDAAMTINTGKNVNVDGDFTLRSNEKGDASFIDNGTVNVSGDTKVERYISKDQWHYFSSPVTDATAGTYMGMFVKYWDESNGAWVYISNAGEPLLSGKGYATWSPGGTTGDTVVEYTGTLNTGDYSPAISLSGDTAADYGWNLVGNAYPSAFDWDDASLTKTNIDNTVYFWDGSQYVTYNGTTHIGSTGITQYVPQQQGFFIHANDAAPALTVTQSARAHSTQQFLSEPYYISGLLRLRVFGNIYKDETMVLFNEDATNGFDADFDAYKLYGVDDAPQLYSYGANNKMAMNVQPFDGTVETVELGFEAGVSGNFTIYWDGVANFPNDMSISLEDTKTNQLIDLRVDTAYTFFANHGDDAHRFLVHFDASAVGVNNVDQNENIVLYLSENNRLTVKSIHGHPLDGTIIVYDILGRIQKKFLVHGTGFKQYVLNLKSGVYVTVFYSSQKIYKRKIEIIK